MNEDDLLSKGVSEKLRIQNCAIKGTLDKITKFFKEYRELMNKIKTSREPFFKALKVELLKSINEREKLEILNEIQSLLSVQTTNQIFYNSYQNDNHSNNQCVPQYISIINEAPLNNQEVHFHSNNEFPSTSQGVNDCSTVSCDDNQMSNISPFSEYIYQNLLPDDSMENENNWHPTENPLFYDSNSISDNYGHHTDFLSSTSLNSEEGNIQIIESLFSQISSLIETNLNVVQELQTCQEQYGNDTCRQLMSYIPKRYHCSIQKIKEEPLIFQLASKYQQFDGAFKWLLSNGLLQLDTKNHDHISLFNFLLTKNISSFYQFLKFLKDLRLTSEVEKICQADNEFKQNLSQKKKSFARDSGVKTKLESIERFCLNPKHA